MDLAKQYNPKEAEENHYKRWETSDFFAPEINEDPNAAKYSIVIPPPNVTGSLHMGHALQHTVMDVLTRWKRMLGYRTLFLPGIDHAGISTQLMVTRRLKEEGTTPQEIGREEFTRRVWDWKEKYGGTILEQIRREGLSVDWSRESFTMEPRLSRAVSNVFVRLFEEGWIYRGARIVNWCPKDRTVLSDLEVEDKPKKDGKLYYLQYPVRSSSLKLTVATTRPETMLGDTAVAVNPTDPRYGDLVGKMVDLPLTGRTIPIIADEYVDPEFGTGAVKITPAHDPNDYEMGERHKLPQINIMNPDGTINGNAGVDFDGLDRFAARKLVVEKFDELGLLEKIDDYEMVLPVCERCKTVIETLVSEQWWVRMSEMRDMALGLKHGSDFPRFTPHNPHTKVYTDWLENLRDWTISRQLWWGHQIPAWYDEQGNVFVARDKAEACEKAGTDKLRQDDDVLDTWFSSWLWSFSTMGWDGETTATDDLRRYHPTDVLVTARDIIFLWVSRMVMAAMKFIGERPFDDVYITGTVLASDGQRMSKTKGNGVDPIEVFDKYGVDATRITLAGSSTGMDFAWRDEKVESYRNFANKIWNAARFCLMNSEGATVDPASIGISRSEPPAVAGGLTATGTEPRKGADDLVSQKLSITDRWIISRLNRTAIEVNQSLEKYAFHTAVDLLYHFFWDDFCDWYIELVKDEISSGQWSVDGGQTESTVFSDVPQSEIPNPKSTLARTRIITILEQALRLLHPFMPYLTEELWQKLPGTDAGLHHSAYKTAGATIMLTGFPVGDAALIDENAESEMKTIIELITRIRNIRAEMRIRTTERIDVHIAADEAALAIFAENEARILKLARAGSLHLGAKLDVPKASAKGVLTNGAEIAVPLEGLIDFEKERERLGAQITNLNSECEKLVKQLSNESFVAKAPPEKVEAVRERVAEIETQLKALSQNLESLG